MSKGKTLICDSLKNLFKLHIVVGAFTTDL